MRQKRSSNFRRDLLRQCLKGFLSLAFLACLPEVSAQVTAQPSSLLLPTALAYDTAGNLYIADANRHQVFEATLAGALIVVAGTGTQGFAGDNGPAALAQLNSPGGLAFGSDGTLYIADTGNARIRTVIQGIITTVAGTGTHGYSGDSGPSSNAAFRSPTALALDGTGALLICDAADHRIRRIVNGSVATFAGNGVQGFMGDGAQAINAELDNPAALAVAADGRVFVADSHDQRVRVIDASGTITTFAGIGQRGFAGDGGPARAAQLSSPRGLSLIPGGTLLVADTDNQQVRAISPAGVITTLVGISTEGESVDGAPAFTAALHSPRALALSNFGMPVFADTLNRTVRVLTPGGTLYQPAALAPGRTSTLTATVGPNLTYGQAAAVLHVTSAIAAAQGQVALLDAGQPIASAPLAGGAASLDLPSANAGNHAFTATYAGDGLNPATTFSLASVTIAPAVVLAVESPVSVEYGAPLPPLTGMLSGVLPQDAGQVSASFNVAVGTTLNAGVYPIGVTLAGSQSANYVLSSSQGVSQLTITQAGSRVVVANLPQAFAGVPMFLSATVSSTTTGQPTGTVQFMNGTNVIATGALIHGSASGTYTAPGAGSLNLSALYHGDTNFSAGSSLPQVAVVSSLPDFGVTVSGPSAATANGGTAATFNLLVSALSGPFTGVVTLSVAGLPTGATASFTPVQVVPGTASATVLATVLVPALAMNRNSLACVPRSLALAGLFCVAVILRRRNFRMLPLLGVCLLTGGCGARTVGEAGQGVALKTYTLQMTGTSTNLLGAVITHTAPVTLTVQN